MRQYRSVFISDVHLGTADCQADYLLDFLNNIQCQTLYLVGDIVDLTAMQRRAHFPDSHRQVIHKLLELAATGTRVVYIPGNHDEFFRRFCGQT
ncbi:MAG TPA: UDP-2,3-diacylglucosamine diphosphatase, partial [Marinobacter sp.]|nr:UDP-2,3-diacylglucosamine diphosphatase [Marinobacter sp.]